MAEGVEYHVRAMLTAAGTSKANAKLARFASGVSAMGDRMQSMGRSLAGTTLQTAAQMGTMAAGLGAMAGAYGMTKMVKSAVDFNEELETSQITIASTMQLMGFFKKAPFTEGLSAADQATVRWTKNMELAEGQMDRVFDIAAKSPASFTQGMTMFKGLLPGATAATHSLTRINKLLEKSLSIGVMMGGDYATAGRQISRILEGGAGAEYVAWQQLKVPIKEAGDELGIFKKGIGTGEKLTGAFNKLDAVTRLELVEKATESLGVSTEAWGRSWVGITSTLVSQGQLLERTFGKKLFESLRESAFKLTQILDPSQVGGVGDNLQKAAFVMGGLLADPVEGIFSWFVNKLAYVANNWQDIADRIYQGAQVAFQAAKIAAGAAVVKTAVGYGMQGAGAVTSGVGAAMDGVPKLANAIMSLGWFAIPATVALAGLAAIVGGALVAVGGVAAVFVSHWDEIVEGFVNGDINIRPLLVSLSLIWENFKAVGNAVLGANTPVDAMNTIIGIATNTVYLFNDAVSALLWAAGTASDMFWAVADTFQIIFTFIGTGVLELLSAIESAFAIFGINLFKGAGKDAEAGAAELDELISGFNDPSKFWEMKSAWDRQKAQFQIESGANAMQAQLDKWVNKKGDPNLDAAVNPEATNKPKGGDTHIYKMVVHQDLRNHDPDRIIGAFTKKVQQSVRQRTGASTNTPGGV